MKINKNSIKKHARKIKNVTEEEFKELQEGYSKLLENVRGMDTPALLITSIVGVAIILIFKSNILDLFGLLVLIYPFYLFANKEGHEEGYYEGYYDGMKKNHKDEN